MKPLKKMVLKNGIKVNKENYCKHLKKKQLFPAVKKLGKRDDWIYVQDSAPSHRSNLPPSSPNVNPLDYFFWDLVKTKVYQGRAGEPFTSEEELKTKIKALWKDCATDLKPL